MGMGVKEMKKLSKKVKLTEVEVGYSCMCTHNISCVCVHVCSLLFLTIASTR